MSSADSEVVDEVKLISMSSSCRGVDEHSGIEGDNESHLRISELQLSTYTNINLRNAFFSQYSDSLTYYSRSHTA